MNNSSSDFADWLYEELFYAYLAARRGKRRTVDEHNFEINDVVNLMRLRDDILMRCYKPSRGIAFIIRRPVIREIFAAPFRDRVVHHFIYNHVADWWDRRFIYDAYSCRDGKGTDFGRNRLIKNIRQVSQNYSIETYVIKLDIQGYFMSLNRKKLYQRAIWGLECQFPNKGELYRTLKYLWREIIFDDPIKGVRRRGKLSDWDDLPASKSLFNQPPGQGIVIGNLTSQLLSNIYLDQLDRFVTKTLGYRHYGRYVDDFYIVVTKKQLEQAKRDIAVIEDYLLSLGLVLHPKKRSIQNIQRGIEFLGAVVYPRRVVPGKRVEKNFRQAIYEYMGGRRSNESITSYLGHLKHINSKKMTARLFDEVGWKYNF